MEDVINEIESIRRDQSNERPKADKPKKLKRTFSNCSCPKCDSVECFSIRHEAGNKTCKCNTELQPCSKYCINNKQKPILKTSVVNEVHKTVDFYDKTSYHKTLKSANGKVDRIIQCKFRCSMTVTDSKETLYERANTKLIMNRRNDTTAQLSAQVMNVAFQDFSKSITKQPYKDSVAEFRNAKLDILTKLKEIYKACSCKVCECIPIKSFFPPTDACSCKPCQCYDCKKLYSYVGNIKEAPEISCPCISCDRKDCKGINKRIHMKQTCDCTPCECYKCTDLETKSCNCEPCGCLDCKLKRTYLSKNFIVASVGQSTQNGNCDCDMPCECSNCVPNYGTVRTLQEAATGTIARSVCPCNNCINDLCQSDGMNCRCEVTKGIITKPIQRDRHDYDIHNVLLRKRDWLNIKEDNYDKRTQRKEIEDKTYRKIQIRETTSDSRCHKCKLNGHEDANRKEIHNVTTQNDRFYKYKCDFCKGLTKIKDKEEDKVSRDCLHKQNKPNPMKTLITKNRTVSTYAEALSKKSSTFSIENINPHYNASQQTYSIEQNSNLTEDTSTDTVSFSTAQNSYHKLRRETNVKHAELSLPRGNNMFCVTAILNGTKYFNEVANCSSLNEERSPLYVESASQYTLDASDNDVPERLDEGTITPVPKIFNESECSEDKNALLGPMFSNSTFDYDKVQRTLREAQEFSLKLQQILETYETTNNNFVSVSERFKMLYDTIFSHADKEFTHKVYFENTERNSFCYAGDRNSFLSEPEADSSNLTASVTTQSSSGYETSLKPILGSHNLLENVEDVVSRENVNVLDKYKFPSLEKVDEHANNFEDTDKLFFSYCNKSRRQKNRSDVFKNSKAIVKRLKSSNRIFKRHSNNSTNTDYFSNFRIPMADKSVRTEDITKWQKDENTEVTIAFIDADFYKDQMSETVFDLSTVKKHIAVGPIGFYEISKQENYEQNWNIFRKNLFINPDIPKQHTFSLFENEVKQAIEIISQELRKDLIEKKSIESTSIFPKDLEEKIYEHIKDVVNKIVSMVVLKSEFTNKTSKAKPSSNLCFTKTNTAMSHKASFSDLRRISDHTVLVKWHIPKNVSDVKGYELQVDGRAVQKIFSPNRSMAVVTCLPHAERVLLTILTLTRTQTPYNSNTIVYYPRDKTK